MHDRHFGLDLCRALAIALVLASHGRYFIEPTVPLAWALRFGGFLGVELFFVLSGYLIGSILYRDIVLHNRLDPRAFWVRRWLRTLPAYYVYLGLNVLAGWMGLAAAASWTSLPAYLTFTQNLAWRHPPFFAEAWSLSVEEVFYLLLPLAALAWLPLAGNRRRAFVCAVASIGGLSLAARVGAVLVLDPSFDEGVRKIVVLRLDALMVGVLLAVIGIERPGWLELGRRLPWRLATAVAAVVVVAWTLQPLAQRDADVISRIVLFTAASLLSAAVIVASLSWRSQQGALAAAVRRLALWSYSAYLANLLVRQLLQPWVDRADPLAAWLGLLLFLAGTLALAAFTYRVVERPCMAWRDRLTRGRATRAVD